MTKNDLITSDNVEARANIYFDYNFPVEANNAETTFELLGTNDFVQPKTIVIAPNPTQGMVYVKAITTIQSIRVYDIQGRMVKEKNVSDESTFINLADLTDGVYFLKISTEIGDQVKKVFKN